MWSVIVRYTPVAVITVSAIGVAFIVELLHPKGRCIARTLGFNTVCAVLMAFWAQLLQPLADREGALLKAVVGMHPIPLPEHGWASLISALIVMLAADLIFYWVHRAQHRFPLLWAMHSFHHSDDDLNGASAYRHYWLEKPLFVLVAYIPLGLVFRISPTVAALYGVLYTFFAIFPHMHLKLELGRLTTIVLGPQAHRIHHSADPRDFNTNFAGAFPLWDVVFGTWRAPAAGEFPATGVHAVSARPGLLEAVLWPSYRLHAARAEARPTADVRTA